MLEETLVRIRDLLEARSIPEPNTGCHLWEWGCDDKGYGRVKFDGKTVLATRLALAVKTGKLPGRHIFACHTCSVPSCVNPDHLYWGSRAQNASDARRAGRTGRYPKVPANWGTQSRVPRMKSEPQEITPASLSAALDYDPMTGVLTWKHRADREVSWNTRRAGQPAGSVLPVGYVYVMLEGKPRLAHRLIWLMTYGEMPSGQIDHINRDRTDNRLANLRLVSQSQNSMNGSKRGNNTSGVIGVSFDRSKAHWRADITVNGQQHYLGRFASKDDAIAARRAAEAEHFGDYAPEGVI